MLQFRPQYIISALLVYTPEQKDTYNQGNNTYIFLERKNIDTVFQVKFMLTSFAKPTNSGGEKNDIYKSVFFNQKYNYLAT